MCLQLGPVGVTQRFPFFGDMPRNFSDFHLRILLHEFWSNLVGVDHVGGQRSLWRLDALQNDSCLNLLSREKRYFALNFD